MASPLRARSTSSLPGLKLHRPGPEETIGHAGWLINGYPASILVWSPEEWATLDPKPADAQPCPNGCRAALRMA